jgi:Holliday junction resolvasome RuvABC endonuclease subunit
MTVIGIDPSSKKIALCITTSYELDEVPQLDVISLPAGGFQATGAAYREVFYFLQGIPSGQVYLEAPIVGRNAWATIVQSQVGGAVMAAVENLKVWNLYMANVSSWKKQVAGKGNLTKPEIAEALQRIWPEAYDLCNGDQDLVDACMINRFGVKHQRFAATVLSRSRRHVRSKSKAKAAGRRNS